MNVIKSKHNLPFTRFLHATGWFGELGEKNFTKNYRCRGWMEIDSLIGIEGVQTKTATTFCDGRKTYQNYENLLMNF